MRIHQHEGMTLALLANAYEGFSSCLPEASIVLLDIFEYAFRTSTGSMQTRLRYAFEEARERFDALECEDPFDDNMKSTPTGSLLAVAITGNTALAMWLGNKVVFHVRGFEVTRTTPHTLREQYRAKDPATHAFIDNLPVNTLAKGIGRSTQAHVPSTATFELLPGDSLVLAHHEHHVAEEVAYAAASFLSPQRAADCLADLALDETRFFSTAMVLRFDDFDFAREIDRLIEDNAAPAYGQAFHEWAHTHRALPVCIYYGGFLAVKRDGTLLPYEGAARAKKARITTDLRYDLQCAIDAALKFPTLASLAPRRHATAQPCERHQPYECPFCLGLGWLPPAVPARMR